MTMDVPDFSHAVVSGQSFIKGKLYMIMISWYANAEVPTQSSNTKESKVLARREGSLVDQ